MRSLRAAGLVVLLVLLPAAPSSAYQRPGQTQRVTVTPDGLPGTGPEFFSGRRGDARVAITPDGRFVAFDTRLTDLVPGDENGAYDVFVRDMETGATERVSLTSEGAEAAGHSYWPSISADGRFVAFESEAANLVPGDTNGFVDVFVHDRDTGETTRISVGAGGVEGDGESESPSISADGRLVSFSTSASNLGGGGASPSCSEIFVADRITGALEHVTPRPDGSPSHGVCTYGVASAISANGRYVTFETQMHDLVAADRNASWDIFVRDLQTNTTERVSVASDETESNYVSYSPSISADGRYVSFYSCASNLVPDDNNSSGTKVGGILGGNTCFDVFVRDRLLGRTERVSVSSNGRESDYGATWTDISADGRYVAFQSPSTNLAAGATQYEYRVYVHDRETRQTEVASLKEDGTSLARASWASAPAISADGRFVAFNTDTQVWRRDRGPAVGVGALSMSPAGNFATASGWAGLAGVPVLAAADPAGDVAPPEAAALGADLTGASLVYRPEEKDVLARISVDAMPTSSSAAAASNYVVPGLGGAPGILHTLFFTVNGQRWEIRAIRANVEEPGYPPPPLIGLWKCDPTCHETLHMMGSYGGTGTEIIARFTLQNVSAAAGASITAVRATAHVGDALGGGLQLLDELSLPSATIPQTELRLGVAPRGTPPGQVAFDTAATLVNGSFSKAVALGQLAPGAYDLWARACVGSVCGASSVPFSR